MPMRLRNTCAFQQVARRRNGSTVTELAFVLPIVLVFIFGTIDFSMIMWACGAVSEGARGGARYAMVHGEMSASPVGPTANNTTVSDKVKTYAPALDTSRLTITSTWGWGNNKENSPVTVTVSYSCPLSVGKLVGLSSVTVSGTTTARITH